MLYVWFLISTLCLAAIGPAIISVWFNPMYVLYVIVLIVIGGYAAHKAASLESC